MRARAIFGATVLLTVGLAAEGEFFTRREFGAASSRRCSAPPGVLPGAASTVSWFLLMRYRLCSTAWPVVLVHAGRVRSRSSWPAELQWPATANAALQPLWPEFERNGRLALVADHKTLTARTLVLLRGRTHDNLSVWRNVRDTCATLLVRRRRAAHKVLVGVCAVEDPDVHPCPRHALLRVLIEHGEI